MSSVESGVISYLKAKISSLPGAPAESRNFYNLALNDGVNNDFIFSIRSGSGSPVPGTVGRSTKEQDFEIEFAKDYVDVNDTDVAVRDAIESIREKFDLLEKAIVGKPSGNVTNVKTPSFDKPQIDEEEKSVSITYTFPVTYYVSTRGA